MARDDSIADLCHNIVEERSPPGGRPVSSATLVANINGESKEIGDAISDLIRFGELEFVNTSGSNMHVRVRLRRPVNKSKEQLTLADGRGNHSWLAYIVSEYNAKESRARRLFSNREAAKQHLEYIADCDDLRPVPGLDNVWFEYLGDWVNEYAVLRKEPIFEQSDHPRASES